MKKTALIALILAFGLVAASCGTSDDTTTTTGAGTEPVAAEEDPFIIGFAIGSTGFMVPFDFEGFVSAQIAVAEINAAGGVLGRQIEVVQADTQSQVELSAPATLEVIEQGAEMIVVSADFDLGGPGATVAQENGMVSFSIGAGSSFFGPPGIGPLAFTIGLPAASEGPALAEWAYNEMGWRSAFIMHEIRNTFNDEFCDTFETTFQNLGGEIVGRSDFKDDDIDFAPNMTDLRAAGEMDVIHNCSSTPAGPRMYRAIRADGFEQPITNQQGMSGDYWKDAVPGLNDTFHSEHFSIYGDDPSDAINALVQSFEEQTGAPYTTAYGLLGYPIIYLWADAVEIAGTFEGAAVANVLESFENHPTPAGPWSFTEDFHINLGKEIRLMETQDGETFFREMIVPEEPLLPTT